MLRRLMMAVSPPASLGHRFWRVYVTESSNGSYVAAQEIEMALSPAGSNQCIGGSPISDGHLGSYVEAYAFDGSRSGVDQCWVSANTTMPHWIGYGFSQEKEIRSVRWVCRVWGTTQSPRSFSIEYADSESGPWTVASSFSGVTWTTAGQVREFSW